MRVVGLDPGRTTGVALIVDGKVIEAYDILSLCELFRVLYLLHPDILIVEDYIIGFRYQSRNVKDPIMAIGVCRLYANLEGIKMVMSNPSKLQGKTKPRGVSPHIWSAQIHALGYKE